VSSDRTCCRKLSCLFEVVAQKSSRKVAHILPLGLPQGVDDLVGGLPAERRIRQHHVKVVRRVDRRESSTVTRLGLSGALIP